jgi:hypothetical protein
MNSALTPIRCFIISLPFFPNNFANGFCWICVFLLRYRFLLVILWIYTDSETRFLEKSVVGGLSKTCLISSQCSMFRFLLLVVFEEGSYSCIFSMIL